jgi:hypothetical protein
MANRTVKIIIGIATIIVFLAWAPWLDTKSVHDRVLMEKGRIDHTINEKGNMVCDYGVMWIPFGRYVASCEGGWFVTFWGQIL